jgi:hypothetical protein
MTRHGLVLAMVLISCAPACGKNPAGPDANCGSALSFTALPVPLSAIKAATVLGNMGPPVHTIPTDHTGFYLNGTGITLSSPGALRVTSVRTTHYLVSPFRQGQSDYSVTGNTCSGYTLTLGHIQTVVGKVESQTGSACETYSTANETVQACRNDNADIPFAAGEAIGTVGGATAGAFDFGLYQNGHQNFFVNPSRYSSLTLSAVCPYDPFTSDLRAQINTVLGDPGQLASGETPVCGSMNVDVAGTAAGIWVLQSAPVNQSGDETNFVALAPHPLFPQSGQTFSIGPAAIASTLNAPVLRYPVSASGRVNRQFKSVTEDGQIYCYVHDAATANFSYFVRVSGGVLTIQNVTHAAGATPCSADPASWAINGSALAFIR